MSENEEAVSRPSVPLPGEEWTEQEQYVWAQVAQGEIANLLTRYQGSDDPTDAEGWPEERVLRPGFLETILFEEPFRSEVRRAGVDIVGAWFREPLDLSQGQIGFVLALQSSRMASDVRCRRLHASADFGFKASAFAGKLDMDGFQVDGSLFMLESVFGEVNLRGARVGDQLAMSGSTFGGTLNMDSLHTRSALLMDDGGTFEEVVLRCARIGGQLAMVASTFTGSLNMNAVQVEGSLLMSGGATFKEVVLRSARIGDQLAMVGSTFNGRIDMTCMQVDGPVFMRSPARFVSDVSMIRIDAKDVLDIRSASFGGVLDLRLATVGVLRDAADAWPEELRLEGFTYATWDESIGKLAPRKAKWFVDWIRRSEGYHPKTYDQCASVLQAAGYDRMAN
ncbi:hypothetical protein HOK31_29870, partial [Candidatus Poribacteria bacterium]|nr:hypothetical protein [Candidatus Poribacteria bacterium]